ncbi:hypothetical protein GCM10011383_31510 [Hymenobacter cavernae]|uniref:Polysaccharide biosynthesis protein C-terminal domain-containing protein n=2 Tax=Hymenobacter cavernae TaxID=2044852 RepID=A0ABQ1UIV8_9BACT|nr:hypothetical protein GCM10011383_31510 [Hymenobacter cavernae]
MALVPLYLSHWNVVTYGIWLAILSLTNLLITLDFGHQEFLAYEFLRIGRDNRPELSRFLWSGATVGLLISLGQILLVVVVLTVGVLPYLLGQSEHAGMLDPELIRAAGIILVLQSISWLICNSISGLFFRVLAPFGYFPRMAWWNLFNTVVSSIAPVVAVLMGYGLLTAGVVMTLAALITSVPMYWDLLRLLRKEGIPFSKPSFKLGYKNFLRSVAISGKGLLENARQQGARLVLAPLSGAAGLAAFSTMRTGANVALQGLNTVINPLMPELMRFLHQRDQERSEAAFGTLWFVLVALMAPAMVVLQAVIEPLYTLWTRGRVTFNPLLFATLSLSVLVYAVAQPAIAVVKGNNLLKAQLALSAVAAVVVVGGIAALVPFLGILGAGIALLAAEVAAMIGYRVVAQRWLQGNGLLWPKHHFAIALASVWIATAGMGAMIVLPQLKWLVMLGSLVLLLGNLWRYWQVLPDLATQHARRIVSNLPGMKRLYAPNKY